MGTSLNGLTPSATYEGLIKFGDNSILTAGLKALSDGAGNDTLLEISTTALQIGGSTGMYWDDTNKRLGVGTSTPSEKITVQTTTAADGIVLKDATNPLAKMGKWFDSSGFIDLSQNGSTYARIQASQSFLNSPFTVGTATAITARLGIKGSGSTSATTALLVQDSAGTNWLQVKDNGDITNAANGITQLQLLYSPVTSQFFRLRNQSVNVDFYAGANGNALIEVGSNAPYSIRATNAVLTLSNSGVRIANSIGTTNSTAQLEIVSTTKGFLPPRMTTTEKNAISTPAAGLVVYDNTVNRASVYSTAWENVITEVNGSPNSVANIWSGSQAQYDALTPSSSTLYFIV